MTANLSFEKHTDFWLVYYKPIKNQKKKIMHICSIFLNCMIFKLKQVFMIIFELFMIQKCQKYFKMTWIYRFLRYDKFVFKMFFCEIMSEMRRLLSVLKKFSEFCRYWFIANWRIKIIYLILSHNGPILFFQFFFQIFLNHAYYALRRF